MSRSPRTAASLEAQVLSLHRAMIEPDGPDILTGGEVHGVVATGGQRHSLPVGKGVIIQTKQVERDDARQPRARLIYRLEFGPPVEVHLGDVTLDREKQALP